VRLFKVFFIIVVTWLTYKYVAGDHTGSGLGDILPFSKYGHSFDYNYAALVMLGIAIWGIWRLYGKR